MKSGLQKQEAQPIDDATREAIELALAERREGDGVTLEQARTIVRKRYAAWQKTQREISNA